MEIEQKLIDATSKTFAAFSRQLAKVDPVAALLVTGAAITPVMIGAFSVELLHQQELYRTAGMDAVTAYQALSPKEPIAFLATGITNGLPTTAQNVLAKSMAALATLPLTACIATLVAGKFENLKKEIATLQQGGREVNSDQVQRVSYPTRETCATRTPESEFFGRSLEAMSRKIEEIQSKEEVKARSSSGLQP